MAKQEPTKKIVAANLRALREHKGLSVPSTSALAKRKSYKIDDKSIRRHEDGENAHTLDTLDMYADLYDVEPWQLLVPGFGAGKPKKPVFRVDFFTDTGYMSSDGVSHGGKLWLVPQWIELPEKQVTMPVRMIRFDDHPMVENPPSGAEYLLNLPVPMSVLSGSSKEGFSVLEGGEVAFAMNLVRSALE